MIFKYLIPFDRFTIHSRMSPVEAVQALQAVVEPQKFLRFSTAGAQPFEGRVKGYGFRITRIIGYRNSWLPVVVGSVTPAPGGSLVRIHMRLLVIVGLFSTAWLCGIGLAAVGLGLQALAHPDKDALLSLIPTGMFVFGLALTNGGFWSEATKQKRMLIDLFGGGPSA